MDFCGKSWNLKTQWTVDELWILARIPDYACLDVRILGPKPEIWIIDLSLAMVGMLMSSSKLFLFSNETHLNSGPVHPYPNVFENGDFFPYLKKIRVHKNTIGIMVVSPQFRFAPGRQRPI